MKRLLMALCLIFAVATAVNAKPLTMEQVLEGTCRIASQKSSGKWHTGTGTCIAEDKEKYWLFTNGHVVDNSQAYRVYFFRNGYRSKGFTGTLEWKNFRHNTNVDFALVTVKKADVGKYFKPRIIPLADEDAVIKRDTFFVTGTCPMGLDALVRQGRVYATENWRFYISEVLPGQSGSGILINVKDKKGELHTKIGGVITWRIAIERSGKKIVLGGVIPIKVIRTVMAGKPYQPHAIPSNFMYSVAESEICWPLNVESKVAPNGTPFLDAYVLGTDGCFYLRNSDGSVTVPPGVEVQCWRLRNLWQRRPGIIIPRTHIAPPQQPYYRQPLRPLVPVRPSPCDPPAPAPGPAPPIPIPEPLPRLEPIPEPGPQPTPAPPRPDPTLPAPDNPAPLPMPDPVEPLPESNPLPPYTNPNLEAELQEAQEQLKKAQEKLQAQQFILKVLNIEIQELAQKYKNSLEWKDKYNESHKKLMEARQQYDVLVGEFNTAQANLKKAQAQTKAAQTEAKEAVEFTQKTVIANNNLRLKAETVENHRNVATGLLGILGLGVLSYVGRCWYKRRGKKKIDAVQDKIGDAAEKIGLDGDKTREITEKLEATLVGLFNKRFPEKPTPPSLPVKQPAEIEEPEPPTVHPDYRQPPPPMEPPPRAYVPGYYLPVQGQGPVPPDYPGRMYSAQDVLNAVDEIAKRHPDDQMLGVVPRLVRQIMDEPHR